MKLGVVTLSTKEIDSYARQTALNKKEYCVKHGYSFINCEGLLIDDRHPSWSKVPLIKSLLPNFDWLLWIDADALIVDDSMTLEKLISFVKDDAFIAFGEDAKDFEFNMGNFLIKNTPLAYEFLDAVLNEDGNIAVGSKGYRLYEQWAAYRVVKDEKFADKYDVLARRRINNAYWRPHDDEWLRRHIRESFIVHILDRGAGVRDTEVKRVLSIMKEGLANIGKDCFIKIGPGYHRGDMLCFVSACKKFADVTGKRVYVNRMKNIVEAYGCDNFRYGTTKSPHISVAPGDAHRLKSAGHYFNYLGTFLEPLGMLGKESPVLDFPDFGYEEPKALLQPFSIYSGNPHVEFVQGLVDTFIDITGMPLYVIGHPNTKRIIKNVDYSLLKRNVPALMKHVQNASFVLTPRSLSAHVAAGYKRPSFVWCPSDGENWHLEYKGWPATRIEFKEGLSMARGALKDAVKEAGLLKD